LTRSFWEVFVLRSVMSCFVYFIVDLVVRLTLHREGEREGKKGTVAA